MAKARLAGKPLNILPPQFQDQLDNYASIGPGVGAGPWLDYQHDPIASTGPWNDYKNDPVVTPAPPPGFEIEGGPNMFADLIPHNAPPLPAGFQVEGNGGPNVFDQFDPPGTKLGTGAKPNVFDQFDAAGTNQGAPGFDLGDVGKSALSGVESGAIGLAGAAGDLQGLGHRIAQRFGISPETLNAIAQSGPIPGLLANINYPTSDEIRGAVENKTGPLYQPQTTPGKYAETIGEFAPAAIGGPEGLGARLATRVVLPGAASEAAGEATEGTPFESAARALGGLAGGVAAGGLADAIGTAALRRANPIPTETQLETAARGAGQGYNDPAVKGLQLAPQAGSNLAQQIRSGLNAVKIDQRNGAPYYDIADALENPRFGPNLTIDDLDMARQDASVNPVTATPADKRAGPVVRNVIDSYLNNIPQADVLAGDAGAANAALTAARGNFAALKRSQDITNAMGRAENQAGATYSGGNLENATRQQLKPILNQKTGVAKSQGFQDYTNDEIAALRNAVNGSFVGNTIRTAGKLLGAGHGIGALASMATGTAAAHEAGLDPLTSLAIGASTALAGRGLSRLGSQLEVNRANAVGQMLRSRSPLAASMGIPIGGYQGAGLLSQLLPLLAPSLVSAQSPRLPQPQGLSH